MPIASIVVEDNFYQWMTKTNEVISRVNTLGNMGSVVSTTSPTQFQILVFDGVYFRNVTMNGAVSIDNINGHTSLNISSTGVATLGRMYFASNIRGLY